MYRYVIKASKSYPMKAASRPHPSQSWCRTRWKRSPRLPPRRFHMPKRSSPLQCLPGGQRSRPTEEEQRQQEEAATSRRAVTQQQQSISDNDHSDNNRSRDNDHSSDNDHTAKITTRPQRPHGHNDHTSITTTAITTTRQQRSQQ